MTQAYSVITKDLNYVLDLVREYRAKAELASRAADSNLTYENLFGQALAYATLEGHIEGMLEIKQIVAGAA